MINTNKLFDLYAAEDCEDLGANPKKSSAPILTKPARSALIKRRKSTKVKRTVPARLKFWENEEEQVAQKTSSQATSQPTAPDCTSTKLSPIISSSKPELLPICLQASSVIDSNLSTTPKTTTLQLDRLQSPQQLQRTGQYAQQSPQASFVFSFKSDSEDEREQSAQDVSMSLLEQYLFGPITYQHIIYALLLGALIAFFLTQLTQTPIQLQQQQTPFQQPFQAQIESPYFPSSSFTLTSATLTPSISAVRIFVAHQHRSHFSFTLFGTRLFAR
jgi:hypothetical protein